MILSRRRKGRFTEADRAMRAAIGDANLVGWYDARFPWTVDAAAVGSWSDARGGGYGPALAQGTADAKPAYSASARTITFDGSDDYLRIASATFNTITAGGTLVVVGTLPSTGGSGENFLAIGASDNSNIMRLARDASDGVFRVQADADFAPQATRTSQASAHVFFGSRTASSGGSITVAASIDTGAEGTASGTAADATWHTLTVGANQAGTVASFADVVVRGVLVIKGVATAAQRASITQWARAAHQVA